MVRFRSLLLSLIVFFQCTFAFASYTATYYLNQKSFSMGNLVLKVLFDDQFYQIDGYLQPSLRYQMLGFVSKKQTARGVIDSNQRLILSDYQNKTEKKDDKDIYVNYHFKPEDETLVIDGSNFSTTYPLSEAMNLLDINSLMLQMILDVKNRIAIDDYTLIYNDQLLHFKKYNQTQVTWRDRKNKLVPIERYFFKTENGYEMSISVNDQPLRIVKLEIFFAHESQLRLDIMRYQSIN